MSEKKAVYVLIGTIALIVALVLWGVRSGQSDKNIQDDQSQIVYYYGDTCPHCKVVSEFLESNHIADTVAFIKKEVWNDQKNAAEMERRAAACGIDPEQIGVPFVYGGDGKCYIGEPDVKKFFGMKAGLIVSQESTSSGQ
jgi:glutaredoxin